MHWVAAHADFGVRFRRKTLTYSLCTVRTIAPKSALHPTCSRRPKFSRAGSNYALGGNSQEKESGQDLDVLSGKTGVIAKLQSRTNLWIHGIT